ncbi:TolC family protein [Komagataeibacter xylinus]|uniref:TolC family protein n=1 Tax=Komagataeibacter xylinus TaxID=28448 RepID=UPI00280B2810|nr:TolC family protein [Komagataeibacter xylinus]
MLTSFLMAAQGNNSAFTRNYDVPGYDAGLMITQPLFRGGATVASTRQAIHNVHAERARLMATEQQVMQDVINAYVGLIETQKILEFSINNEKLLEAQAAATHSRFGAGDVTRTDTAQAETALSIAQATRQDAEAPPKMPRRAICRSLVTRRRSIRSCPRLTRLISITKKMLLP